MNLGMSHLRTSQRSNKPVGAIPTYGVPPAYFQMTGGIPSGYQFTTPFAVSLYNCVMLPFPYPTSMESERAKQQAVVRVSRYSTATRSNRLLENPSSMTDGYEPTEHPLFNAMSNSKITIQ